jgi:hypothetical protein
MKHIINIFYVQTEVFRACKSRFDEPDPGVGSGYLVKHEKGTRAFCWAHHAFKVIADKAAGV